MSQENKITVRSEQLLDLNWTSDHERVALKKATYPEYDFCNKQVYFDFDGVTIVCAMSATMLDRSNCSDPAKYRCYNCYMKGALDK